MIIHEVCIDSGFIKYYTTQGRRNRGSQRGYCLLCERGHNNNIISNFRDAGEMTGALYPCCLKTGQQGWRCLFITES